jgi:hypothetical protein
MIPEWTAEQTAHPDAKADRWALIYDPTPGGRDTGNGTRSYGLRFPALLLSDLISNPKDVAEELAEMLNEAEQIQPKFQRDMTVGQAARVLLDHPRTVTAALARSHKDVGDGTYSSAVFEALSALAVELP